MKTQEENVQIHEMLEHLEKAFKVVSPTVKSLEYVPEEEIVVMESIQGGLISANVHMNSVPAVLRDTVKQLGAWL